jgi:hypothetical protein
MHPEIFFPGLLLDVFDHKRVGGVHQAPGAIAENFADEMADEEILASFTDDFLEARNVLVSLAGREFTGRIDFGGGLSALLGLGVRQRSTGSKLPG